MSTPEPEPIYEIHFMFTSAVLAETIGLSGLMQKFPQLEPELYEIHEAGKLVATGERRANGSWTVYFLDGLILGPGCIIV